MSAKMELNDYQAKLTIFALEHAAFFKGKQAAEFHYVYMLDEAVELARLAAHLRNSLGWPTHDPV